MQNRIQTIKVYFFILATAVVGLMAAGIYFFHDNYTFSSHLFRTARAYAEYSLHSSAGIRKFDILAIVARPFQEPVAYEVPRTPAEAIPVLAYHGILEEPDHTAVNVTEENFKDQLFALKEAGYETITTDELYKYMRGEIDLSEKSIMITFDDGRSDSFYRGDPYLSALGYEAVMFVITKYSLDEESSYYLSGKELVHMQQTGRWDIQVHTHEGHNAFRIGPESAEIGHFFSHKLWNSEKKRLETDEEYTERVRQDLATAKEKLSRALEKEVTGFTFPFGDYGQYSTNFPEAHDVLIPIANSYYNLIFYQDAPHIRFLENYQADGSAREDTFFIRRISVESSWDGKDLLAILSDANPKSLPYADIFNENNGWVNAWGELIIENGRMTIRPRAPSQTGGGVVLDGSRAWKDYKLTTTLESPNRNSAFVWVRFQNDDNNAACNFGKGFVHIEQVLNGQKRVIKGHRDPDFILPEGPFEVGVEVSGRTVKCMLNGEVLVETPFLDPQLDTGGVGYKTWDATLGKSILFVKDLAVEPL